MDSEDGAFTDPEIVKDVEKWPEAFARTMPEDPSVLQDITGATLIIL